MHPSVSFQVNKLAGWYIIVAVDFWQVIVIYIIVASRTPLWLCANVDAYANLCFCRLVQGTGQANCCD